MEDEKVEESPPGNPAAWETHPDVVKENKSHALLVFFCNSNIPTTEQPYPIIEGDLLMGESFQASQLATGR